ncbi:TPR repeat-containing thioredoxin TTL1 [Rhynchospora pubera]|uniref:TPR repeat-containing thioredoxin TTL1 n=1 Tax=Rhynchospora pubera TaxID=906938 RepID=A0AAV8DNF8_9POAL|nr:TPR repeat-containing thioredoxin TTL1 [Rhynchospora pubera]
MSNPHQNGEHDQTSDLQNWPDDLTTISDIIVYAKAEFAKSDESKKEKKHKPQPRRSYMAALNNYGSLIQKYPNNPSYRTKQAEFLLSTGKYEDALVQCQAAKHLDPALQIELQPIICLCYLNLDKLDAAWNEIQVVEEKDKVGLLELFAERKKIVDDAKQNWKTYLEATISAVCDTLWLTALLQIVKVTDFAEIDYRMVLALKAEILFQLNAFNQADVVISQALKKDLKEPDVNIFDLIPKVLNMKIDPSLVMGPRAYPFAVAAEIKLAIGRFDEALELAQAAYTVEPSNAVLTFYQKVQDASEALDNGNNFYQMQHYEKAIKEYKEGLKHAKNNSLLLTKLASCQFYTGKWADCRKSSDEAVRFCPDSNNQQGLILRAYSNIKLKKWEKCIWAFERLLDRYSKEVKIHDLISAAIE